MNELQVFNNEQFGEIRTVEINNEAWFVGKDVAEILEYSNPQKAIRDHVADEDKTVNDLFTVNGTRGILINESGLYSLILSSKLPKAKEFKHWVTSEVLPTIRKHGMYAIDEIIANPDMAIAALSALKEEREKNKVLSDDVARMKPKEIFADAVATSEKTILIGELAKILKQNGVDTGEKRLFKFLRENGYLIKRKGTDWNSPTQKSMDMGLFEVKETAVTHSDGHVTVSKTTKVTGRGQIYFVNKFAPQLV